MEQALITADDVEAVSRRIDEYDRANGAHAMLSTPSLADVCKKYNAVAPYLKMALPLMQKAVAYIPKVGKTISDNLESIFSIADLACAVAPAPNLRIGVQPLTLLPLPAQAVAEDTKYTQAKISNGYGLMNKVGVTVQIGVTADIDVAFHIKTVSENSLKQWYSDNSSCFTDDEKHTLEENYAAGGFMGGFLGGCFGCVFGGGTYNHYKNQTDQVVKTTDEKQQGFLKSLSQLQQSEVVVTGHIQATGQSYIPVEGFVYVETTTVEFSDGTTLTVVNTNNPVVADGQGDTSQIKQAGDSKLTIVPVSTH